MIVNLSIQVDNLCGIVHIVHMQIGCGPGRQLLTKTNLSILLRETYGMDGSESKYEF